MDTNPAASTATRANWPRWTQALLVPAPLLAWHDALARLPAATAVRTPHAVAARTWMPWAGTGVVAAAVLAEAWLYGMLWRARGRRLRRTWTALQLLQLSVLELLASRCIDAGGGAPWRAWLAGPRAAWPGAPPGALAAAFGSAGAFAAVRVGLAALVQAAGSGAPWREALAVVVCVWLASHLLLAWVLAMTWGRSVMP